jgi:HSP20 family protein
MELTRTDKNSWNPFELAQKFDRDWDSFFRTPISSAWTGDFQPRVEIQEEDDAFILSAELAGLKKDDIKVSVDNNRVTLKGERKTEGKKKGKGYHYSEHQYGSFTRTFEFPAEIQGSKVKASFKDGVLEVTLPKSEQAKPKEISIDVK